MQVSLFHRAFLIGCVSITLSACIESREAVKLEPLTGFDEELDTLVPKLLDDFDVPGAAVGIIHDGEIWMKRGFGYADVATNNAIDTSTAFNIGSISKTVASWGVMKLVETGDLDLNAHQSDADRQEVECV